MNRAMTIIIDTHSDDYNIHRAKIVVATYCWRAPSDQLNKNIDI